MCASRNLPGKRIELRVERFMLKMINDKGQGMVEYVLAITSISMVALLNLGLIARWLDSFIGSLTMLV